MEVDELQERIAAFANWHYEFQFDNGVSTPMPARDIINRHEQRRRYFFEPLLDLTGGSLSGHRVLDLGCNAGFWSLAAVEAGADFVLGVDGQQTYIDQAKLVFEAKNIDPARYRFEQGNVFGHDIGERFDVVLCLGLMDRVSKPVELFELMMGAGAELIVIDTQVSRARLSLFEVDSMYDRQNVVDYELVLIPSRAAVIELASQFGFKTVPLALNITDYSGMKDYRRERRLAFVCSNNTSLDSLAVAKRPVAPWWITIMAPKRG